MLNPAKEHESNHGKLVALSASNDKYLSCAYEIEKAFSIDENFTAEKNLVTELLDLMALLPSSEKINIWLETLDEINKKGEEYRWDDHAKTRSGGNPMGGKLEIYPIPAFILQPSNFHSSDQAVGLKALFLYHLIHRNEDHQLDTCATHLRRAISPKSRWIRLIKAFPKLSTFDDYHEKLKGFLNHPKVTSALDQDRELHNALKRISETPSLIGSVKLTPKPELKPLPLLSLKPKIKNNTTPLPDGNNGSIWSVFTRDFIDNEHLNEPNQQNLVYFFSDQDSDEQGTADFQSLDTEVEQNLAESRYWLSRVEKLVPNDYGRFTKMERLSLVKFIKEKIASHSKHESMAAGLIGLMYLTGFNLDDLWQVKLGKEGGFQENGFYRRPIKLPQNSFKPDADQQQYFQPVANQLLLPLPEPIASWLSELSIDKFLNFEAVFELKLDEVKSLIYSALNDLRKQTRLDRIRPERLPTALALEATLKFRNPLITYLIASRETQAPPMLSYYAVHSVQELVECYKQVVSSLLEPEC